MFRVKGRGNTIVWDSENNKVLAHFKGGIFETEDEAVAKRLRSLGYDAVSEAEKKKRNRLSGEAE